MADHGSGAIAAVPGRSLSFWIGCAVAGSSLLTLLLAGAARLDPIPLGLRVEHVVAGAPESGAVGIDSAPSTNHLLKQWNGAPPETFGETWTGAVCPLRDGIYRFATVSDGTTEVLVDGQAAVHALHLTPGAHSLLIRYAHRGGPVSFELLWARGDETLLPVPAWALRPHKIRSTARLIAGAIVDRALALNEWVWVGLLVLAAAALARSGIAALGRSLEGTCAWRPLIGIVAASFALNAAGIWWGLPGSWVAIELKPHYIFDALAQHFSHGWFDAYPPVHFYLLTVAWTPLLLLSWMDRITFDGAVGYGALVLTSRVVSLVMAAGMVVAACVCGTRAFGRRAGLIAAGIIALSAPFVYYAKTANVDVPYLFWWALSMIFYLQLLDGGRLRDYVLFAVAATLSVCTKDQAYGLYLLPPAVIVWRIWRVNRAAAQPHPFWRALVDRRLLAAAVVSAALFTLCQNLVFNPGGFREHVRFITGPGSAAYRVYEPTLGGHLALLGQTVRLIAISMGWPLFLVGVCGVALAMADTHRRRMAVWLLVPIASYYLGFIDVILYNYDRFVLPMCFVLAIFGGLALDWLLSARSLARGLRAVVVAGAFAYSLLYAGTVDMLMIEDSRYDAERWMDAHARRTDPVAISGLHEYLPRLDEFPLEEISSIERLRREQPEYVVLNVDYARAVPPETAWGQMIGALNDDSAGYRRVARFRHAPPWSWLPFAHPDLVGARQETIVFSTLRNINPTIDIFQRTH
jgi:Dolichyl-phosphate-mannose-protein mannosyltransferase